MDFGFARKADSEDHCGTPLYAAPEIVFENKCHINSDMWSVGIIMYILLSGKEPPKTVFNHDGKGLLADFGAIDLYAVAKQGLFRDVLSPKELDHIGSLLTPCLVENPEERLSSKDYVNHPFFKTLLWTDDTFLEKANALYHTF